MGEDEDISKNGSSRQSPSVSNSIPTLITSHRGRWQPSPQSELLLEHLCRLQSPGDLALTVREIAKEIAQFPLGDLNLNKNNSYKF